MTKKIKKNTEKPLTRGYFKRELKKEIKNELKNYPTKEDLRNELRNYPTKEDLRNELRNYPTKEDLRNELKKYPTKEDLRNELKKYATNKDLQDLKKEVKRLEERMERGFSNCVSRVEFEDFRAYVVENMFTKKDFMKFAEHFEEALQEIRDFRIEREVSWRRFSVMDDTVADHEKRLTVLEHK